MTLPRAFTDPVPLLRKPGEFPEIIDNTMRCDFVACPQQFKRRYIDLLTKASVTSIHLEFGGAYARGLEVTRKLYYGGYASLEDAMARGFVAMTAEFAWADSEEPDEVKNYERLCATFVDYWRKYPPDTDYVRPAIVNDEPAVEFNFILPIEEVLHPVTKQPLLYSGRADMLADMNGAMFVYDDKTAGSLGAQWASSWELRSQFTGYCCHPDTEVLTRRGWIKFPDLAEGEEIMVYEENGTCHFEVPSAIHKPEYSGPMLEVDGKVHCIVTPDHRVPFRSAYSGKMKWFYAKDIPWGSGDIRFVSAARKNDGYIVNADWIRLVVAYQADGQKRGNKYRFHFRKDRKIQRLINILEGLEVPYSYHPNSDGTREIKFELSEELPDFGEWLLSLNYESLKAFIDETAFWDGSERGARGSMFFSSNEKAVDWVRTIASLVGRYSSEHTQDGVTRRVNITENCHHSAVRTPHKEVSYSGRVYCVTVSTGMFMIRSSGRISVTGNCWAAKQFGYPVAGAIIRGVGILKTETKHGEAIVYRPAWRIERWYSQLVRDLRRMIALWEEGYFDYAESDACNAWGGCEFRDLCSSPNPADWYGEYNRLIWDPTTVRRIPVEVE